MSVDLLGADGTLLWTRAYLPDPPPAGWHRIAEAGDGAAYDHRDGRRVILSGNREADGRRWLHLSVSRRGRLPSWDDLTGARDDLLPADRYAYQVFPPRDRWVDIHKFCLHLWVPLDGPPPLPEFSAVVAGVRTI